MSNGSRDHDNRSLIHLRGSSRNERCRDSNKHVVGIETDNHPFGGKASMPSSVVP